MESQFIKCSDCGEEFEYTEEQQEYIAKMEYNPPKRCVACREAKKKRMNIYNNRDRG